jgi:hypothetical protein
MLDFQCKCCDGWWLQVIKMTLSEFQSYKQAPPLSTLLVALWHDGQGDWHKAHELAQDIETPDGAWVHAYLHRKEGDKFNANYWYQRVGKKFPTKSLKEEWEEIVIEFLR